MFERLFAPRVPATTAPMQRAEVALELSQRPSGVDFGFALSAGSFDLRPFLPPNSFSPPDVPSAISLLQGPLSAVATQRPIAPEALVNPLPAHRRLQFENKPPGTANVSFAPRCITGTLPGVTFSEPDSTITVDTSFPLTVLPSNEVILIAPSLGKWLVRTHAREPFITPDWYEPIQSPTGPDSRPISVEIRSIWVFHG